MMNEVEALLSSEKVSNIFSRAVKNYFHRHCWELGSVCIGDCFSSYDFEDSPWETYEEFLAADEDERSEWCSNNDYSWFETDEDAWEYFAHDMFESEYEYFVHYKHSVEELFEFLECYADTTREDLNRLYHEFLEDVSGRLYKKVKQTLGLDYRNNKNKAAAKLFCGMLSGYFDEDEFEEFIYDNYDYEFNKDKFNFQEDLDLAGKFIDNTLSIADKAEAGIIFNDIKERLIAA